MEYVIETQHICKQYKNKLAVNDVSIHVKRGDIYGLIGRNGAGKTTLMKLILGLCAPTSGQIMLFGGEELNSARTKVGSLIEAPGIFGGCSAYENLYRFSLLYGADKNEIRPLLEKVGLGDTGNKKASQFSLGMKQRLGIAISMLAHPEILILDEPVNGLDPAGIADVRNTILELNKQGMTFIISSHLLDELAKVVTTYGIMSDGKITSELTAEEINEKCKHTAHIKCDNLEAGCSLIRALLPDVELDVRQERINLYSHTDKTKEINAHLINNGVGVSEIFVQTGGVEEFFIERLGR